jgi:asparagine synthase (glutamine-hydrolysing)
VGGIAAIVDYQQAIEAAVMDRLAGAVALRGPDQNGRFTDGPVALAQHRNRVTPGGCKQPIITDRYVLAFDGRLYDHVDLARRVEGNALGRRARPPGDAEVLLDAWRAWGPACLERLDGAWAIAIWDRAEEALYLARDPLGLRPLYYAVSGGRIAVASLPDRLVSLPWVSRELQRDHLCEYLAFRYVHAPRTLLRDVQALPPGCLLRFDRRGTRIEQAISLAPGRDTQAPDKEQGVRELDRLMKRALTRRARTGGPVGLLLSGGTDSTALALAAVSEGLNLQAYHLQFPETGVDEAAFAGRVAKLLELPLQQVELGVDGFDDALERCTQAMGAPLPDPGAVGQYVLFRAARRDSRVVLSGTGGDELLAGGHLAALALVMKQVGVLDRAACRLRCRVDEGLRGAGLSDLALRPMRYGLQRLAGGTEVFDDEARVALLGRESSRPRLRRDALLPLYTGLDADPINTLLTIFRRGWLVEDTLARADRLAQACGVEHRLPMLDKALVSYLDSIPGAWKVRTHWGLPKPKWPLRRLLSGRVPRSVYDRPKRSWPAPLNRWLRREGATFLQARAERLLDAPWGLWEPDPVRAMVRAHLQGDRYHGGALWVLILLETWLRQRDAIAGS